MSICTYLVTLTDGQRFRMSGNFAEASAGIWVNWHEDEEDAWQSTPYQTADARHSPDRGAKLCAEYNAERDACTEVDTVEPIEQEEAE